MMKLHRVGKSFQVSNLSNSSIFPVPEWSNTFWNAFAIENCISIQCILYMLLVSGYKSDMCVVTKSGGECSPIF